MSTPLRTLVHELLYDPSARAAFGADPGSYLDTHGWNDLDGLDVGTALHALRQELPIDDAIRLGPVDIDAFGHGDAVAGLQTATAGFADEWPDDPATTLDVTVADEDRSNDLDERTDPEPDDPEPDDPEPDDPDPDDVTADADFEIDDGFLDDPLLAIDRIDDVDDLLPPDDLDLDIPTIDDGFDDG